MNLVDLNVNSLNNKFLDKEPQFILEQSIKKLFKNKLYMYARLEQNLQSFFT